jgi:hypothetical protein
MRAFFAAPLIALALPAGASAALTPVIPPGNSAANQYVESVPTAGGGTSSSSVYRNGHHGRAGGASTPVLAATENSLQHQGADGRGLTAVLRATATGSSQPATGTGGRHHTTAAGPGASGSGGNGSGGGGAGGPTGTAPGGSGGSTGGSSATAAVVRSLTGLGAGSGTGVGLWIVLLVSTLGVAAAAVRRRRVS